MLIFIIVYKVSLTMRLMGEKTLEVLKIQIFSCFHILLAVHIFIPRNAFI